MNAIHFDNGDKVLAPNHALGFYYSGRFIQIAINYKSFESKWNIFYKF